MTQAMFKPGDRLGSFVIQEREEDLRPLQRYRAKHAQSHEIALICVRDLSDAPPSPESALAFKMRAEPLFALHIDAIPKLLDVDIQDGFQWAAFAFPEGTPLHDFVADDGRLQPLAGAQLLRAIGAVLHEARAAGAHGLLQTNAIYVDAEGSLRHLLHFGLASLFEIGPEALLHCPPEQWNAAPNLTESADIYAAAAIVWEVIVGNEPGAVSKPDPHRKERLKKRFPRLRSVRAEVPEGLCQLLFDWTSHDKHERPASWSLALSDLDAELTKLVRVAHRREIKPDLAETIPAPPRPKRSRPMRKAVPIAAFVAGTSFLGAAALVAVIVSRAPEAAPPSTGHPAPQATIEPAQISDQIPAPKEPLPQVHNSNDPKGEAAISKGRPRPRHEANKRESPIDRFEPQGRLKARIYRGSHED